MQRLIFGVLAGAFLALPARSQTSSSPDENGCWPANDGSDTQCCTSMPQPLPDACAADPDSASIPAPAVPSAGTAPKPAPAPAAVPKPANGSSGGNAAGANDGFGPAAPAPAQYDLTGKPAWYGFKFANPTTGDQKNFNFLAGIDPALAFSYAWQGGNQLYNDLVDQMNPLYGAGTAQMTGFMFTNGGAEPHSEMVHRSGLGDDYVPSNYWWSHPMGAGGTFTYKGQQYKVPYYTDSLKGRLDPRSSGTPKKT